MMCIKDFFNWLAGLTKPKVTVEATPEDNAPVETTVINGGVASLVKTATAVTTTTTTPAEVADTDLNDAITIVNNVKAALSSPIAVLVTDLIPGTIDDTIREELVTDLPLIAAGLANIKTVIDTADKSAVMNDVLAQIRLSPNLDLDAFYHSLAAKLLTKVTKGGVDWSLAVMSVEYFFKNLFSAAPAASTIATGAVAAASDVEQVAAAVAKVADAPAPVQSDLNTAGDDINDLNNFIQK
jgi:hypothetical protein